MDKPGSEHLARFGMMEGRARALLQWLCRIRIFSDEVNRRGAWVVIYRGAYELANDFVKKKKMSYAHLSNALLLETLTPSQALRLQLLLDKGDVADFARLYARWKTENVHFRYDVAGRSMVEQNPYVRAGLGVITYTRGVWEIVYQNGVKPLFLGLQTKSPRLVAQGLWGVMLLLLGWHFARRALKKLTGKEDYEFVSQLFGYSILSPGISTLKNLMDKWGDILRQGREEDVAPGVTATRLLGATISSGIPLVPMGKAVPTYYEAFQQKRGVTVWGLLDNEIRKLRDQEPRIFAETDRTFVQSVQHFIFGGHERPPEDEGPPF
jgi:hypothetical protein